MKTTRYIVGVIGFLLVWFVVALIVGLLMTLLFPRPGGGPAMIGISSDFTDWRNLPGTVLGLLAGIQSFRASIRPKKADASLVMPTPITNL